MPRDGISLIQEKFNHCPLSVVTARVVSVPLALCAPVFINTLVVSGTESLGMAPSGSSTPPIKCLAGTLVELGSWLLLFRKPETRKAAIWSHLGTRVTRKQNFPGKA